MIDRTKIPSVIYLDDGREWCISCGDYTEDDTNASSPTCDECGTVRSS